jgi:hypothetical protein
MDHRRYPNGTGNFQPMSTSFSASNNGSIAVQEDNAAFVQLYPNPFQEHFQILSTEPIDEIAVYDGTGKRIVKQKGQPYGEVIETSSWPIGIYIIDIQSQRGDHLYKKLVKQ